MVRMNYTHILTILISCYLIATLPKKRTSDIFNLLRLLNYIILHGKNVMTALVREVLYICPMHPEIQQNQPGSCPICGMALEPKTGQEIIDESEYRDMRLRFWIAALLSIPVLF